MGIPTPPDGFASLVTQPGPIYRKDKEQDPVLTQLNDKGQVADQSLESSLQSIGGGGEIHVGEHLDPGTPLLAKPKEELTDQIVDYQELVESGLLSSEEEITTEDQEGDTTTTDGEVAEGEEAADGETTTDGKTLKKDSEPPTSTLKSTTNTASARLAAGTPGTTDSMPEETPVLDAEGVVIPSDTSETGEPTSLPDGEQLASTEGETFTFQDAYPDLDPDKALLLQSFGRGGTLEAYSKLSFTEIANMMKNGEMPELDNTLIQYASMGEDDLRSLGYLSNKQIQQILTIKLILENAQREETVKNLTAPDGPLNMMAEKDPASIMIAVKNGDLTDAGYPPELLEHLDKSYDEIMAMVEKGELTPEEAAKILELQAVNSAAVSPANYRVQGNYMQFLAMLADFLEELKIEMQEQGYEEIGKSQDIAEGDSAGMAAVVAEQQGEVLGPEEQTLGEEISEAFVDLGNSIVKAFGGTVDDDSVSETDGASTVTLPEEFSVNGFFTEDLATQAQEADQGSGSVQQFLKALNQLISLVEGMKSAAEGGGSGALAAVSSGSVAPLGGSDMGVPDLSKLQEMSGVNLEELSFGSEYSASAEFGDLEAPTTIQADNLFNGLTPAFMESFKDSVQSSFMIATSMLALSPGDPQTTVSALQMIVAPFESISPGFMQAVQGLIDLMQIAFADPNAPETIELKTLTEPETNPLARLAGDPGLEPPGGYEFVGGVELEASTLPDSTPTPSIHNLDIPNLSLNFTASDARLTQMFSADMPLSNYSNSSWSGILMDIQNNQISYYNSSVDGSPLLNFVGKSDAEISAAGLPSEDIEKVKDLKVLTNMADREMNINNLFTPGSELAPLANLPREEVFDMIVNNEVADYPPALLEYVNLPVAELQRMVDSGMISDREKGQVIELQSLLVVVTSPAYFTGLQGTAYARGIPPAESPNDVIGIDPNAIEGASSLNMAIISGPEIISGGAFISKAYDKMTADLPKSDQILLSLFTKGGSLEGYGNSDWTTIWNDISAGKIPTYPPSMLELVDYSIENLKSMGKTDAEITHIRELATIKMTVDSAALTNVPPPSQFRFEGSYMKILAAVEELINQVRLLMLEAGYGDIDKMEDAALASTIDVYADSEEEEEAKTDEDDELTSWEQCKLDWSYSTYYCFGDLYSDSDRKAYKDVLEDVNDRSESAQEYLDDLKSGDGNEWQGTFYGFEPTAFEDLFVTQKEGGEEEIQIDAQSYAKLLVMLQKLFNMLKAAAEGKDVGGGLKDLAAGVDVGSVDLGEVMASITTSDADVTAILDKGMNGAQVMQSLLGGVNGTDGDMEKAISDILEPYATLLPDIAPGLNGIMSSSVSFVQLETGVTTIDLSKSNIQETKTPFEFDPSADFFVKAKEFADNLYNDAISQLSSQDQVLMGLLAKTGPLSGYIEEGTSWSDLWNKVQTGEVDGAFDPSLMQYIDLSQDDLNTLGLDPKEIDQITQMQTLKQMADSESRATNLLAVDGVFARFADKPQEILQKIAKGEITDYPPALLQYMGLNLQQLNDKVTIEEISEVEKEKILDLQAIANINVQPSYYRFVGNYLAVLAQVAGWMNQIQAMMMAAETQSVESMAQTEIANNTAAVGILSERINIQTQMREKQEAMKYLMIAVSVLAAVIALVATIASAGTLGPVLVAICIAAIAVSATFAISEAAGKSLTQDLLMACGESRTEAEKKDWIAKLVIAIILTVITLGAGAGVLIANAAAIGTSVASQVAQQAAKIALQEAAKQFIRTMVPMMCMQILGSCSEPISTSLEEDQGLSKEEAAWATMGIMLAASLAFVVTSIASTAKAFRASKEAADAAGDAVQGGGSASSAAGGAGAAGSAGSGVPGVADDAANAAADAADEAADAAAEAVSTIKKALATITEKFKEMRTGVQEGGKLESASKVLATTAAAFEIIGHATTGAMAITMAVLTMDIAEFEKEIADLNAVLGLIDAENKQLSETRTNIVDDFVANYSETTNQIDQIFFQAAGELSGIMSQLHNSSGTER